MHLLIAFAVISVIALLPLFWVVAFASAARAIAP